MTRSEVSRTHKMNHPSNRFFTPRPNERSQGFSDVSVTSSAGRNGTSLAEWARSMASSRRTIGEAMAQVSGLYPATPHSVRQAAVKRAYRQRTAPLRHLAAVDSTAMDRTASRTLSLSQMRVGDRILSFDRSTGHEVTSIEGPIPVRVDGTEGYRISLDRPLPNGRSEFTGAADETYLVDEPGRRRSPYVEPTPDPTRSRWESCPLCGKEVKAKPGGRLPRHNDYPGSTCEGSSKTYEEASAMYEDRRREDWNRQRWSSRKTARTVSRALRRASQDDRRVRLLAASEGTNHRYRIDGTAIEVVQENGTWLWENTEGEGWSGGFASPIDAAQHWSRTYGVPFGGLRRLASSEDDVRVPPAIDTLRDEACPVCSDVSYDGEQCLVCGYLRPPDPFTDPDLSVAQDLREGDDPPDREDGDTEPRVVRSVPDGEGGSLESYRTDKDD